MSKKARLVLNCDESHARMLIAEIGKVRCWLTGFAAARYEPGILSLGVPGEDSLRQIQLMLNDALSAGKTSHKSGET